MSEPSYGPVGGAAELSALVELQSLAFNLSPEFNRQWCADCGPERLRAYRAEGRVVGCAAIHPFGQFWGGRLVPMAGIDGVGIDPAARGRGHARALMTEILGECRARAIPLSTLWPSTEGPYRGVGYAVAGVGWRWRVPLHDCPPKSDGGGCPVRRFTEADRSAVEAAYGEWAARRNGQVARDAFLWKRAFERHGRHAVGWIAGRAGAVEGFVSVHQERAPSGSLELELFDCWATTPAGARGLWDFLREHRAQAEAFACEASPADPLWFWLTNQDRQPVRAGAFMLRVVDVAGALTARGYPVGVRGALHLRVRDALIPGNDGAVVLHVADGAGGVEAGGRGDLDCDVAALAPLYTGHASASQLVSAGRCRGTPAALALADAAFAGPQPWMADQF